MNQLARISLDRFSGLTTLNWGMREILSYQFFEFELVLNLIWQLRSLIMTLVQTKNVLETKNDFDNEDTKKVKKIPDRIILALWAK